ncbi:MAG: SGNH/GDSL hydrolase family protein [Acidobacteriota bacterium]
MECGRAIGIAFVTVAAVLATATPVAAQTPRVLLVGDSWAAFFWQTQALRQTFATHGYPEFVEQGAVTAISGSTAAEWTDPALLQLITDELAANPTIDIVQITLGGNDFLNGEPDGWYVGILDPEALYADIVADVATVVDHTLALDPDLQILVSGYDYPNFVESLGRILAFVCIPLWNGMNQPDPTTLNQASLALGDEFDSLAATRERVDVIPHWGLMQFVVGDGAPPPGDPTQPSPIEAMALQSDCIHLSSAGYLAVAESLWQSYYQQALTEPIFADGFEDGDVGAWSGSVP